MRLALISLLMIPLVLGREGDEPKPAPTEDADADADVGTPTQTPTPTPTLTPMPTQMLLPMPTPVRRHPSIDDPALATDPIRQSRQDPGLRSAAGTVSTSGTPPA